MKVILAKTAGFCMGVRRAINLTNKAIEKNKQNLDIYTYGELIHNPQVIEMLEKRNVFAKKSLENMDEGSVIIRSHGISPKERDRLIKSELTILDATCPRVSKVQSIIKKHAEKGYSIVIVGDKGHSEVIGLLGYAGKNTYIISKREDLENIPTFDKVCIVSQTTQNKEFFKDVVIILKGRFSEYVVFDTICDSTHARQDEVQRLCKKVDAMVVIGGKNSANTARLVEIAKSQNVDAYFAESENDIRETKLRKYKTIGVTAGASTPNWVINKVIAKLEAIPKEGTNIIGTIVSKLKLFILRSRLYTSFGALLLLYFNLLFLGLEAKIQYYLIAFLYIVTMHVYSNETDKQTVSLRDVIKITSYFAIKRNLIITAIIPQIIALIISVSLGFIPFLLVLLCTFFGLAYQEDILSSRLYKKIFNGFTLHRVPASKNIFMAFAWTVVMVFIPVVSGKKEFYINQFLLVSVFTFCLVFIRSVIFSIKDLHEDKIVGREVLPNVIGKKNAFIVTEMMGLAFIFIVIFMVYLSKIMFLNYLLIFPIIYAMVMLFLFFKKPSFLGINAEAMIDGVFILTGIFGLFISILN